MDLLTRNRQVCSYVVDYLVVLVCIAGFSILDLAEPHHQQFSLSDIYLQQTYAVHERVPAFDAAIIAILVPIVFMCFWCLTFEGRVITKRRLDFQSRLWEVNMSVLGLALSVCLALVTTNIFKNTVGRPRPDFIDRCQPVTDAVNLVAAYGLSNSTICQQSNHAILKDGFRSFPSGHSSTSFSGLGYLAIWLSSKLRVLDGSGQVWKIVLVAVPMLAASLIAISRIMDERHHPFDVMFGCGLGFLSAWISYRQYYPSVRQGSVAHGARTYGPGAEAIRYQATEPLMSNTYLPAHGVNRGSYEGSIGNDDEGSELNGPRRGTAVPEIKIVPPSHTV